MYTGSLAAASNRADWVVDLDIENEDGTPYNWATVSKITIVVVRQDTRETVLSGSLEDGKIIVSATPGRIQWRFSPSEMGALSPGTYDLGLAYKRVSDGVVVTEIVATLPIIEGVASI